MRIISGKYKGRKLFTPTTYDIRPTSDRAREAIFSILMSEFGSDFADCKVLDVFAGTGTFAFEAISRGAKEVCLIDKDISLASKNASLFPKEKEIIKLQRADVISLPISSSTYDIVFMDAPYGKDLSVKTLLQLKEKGWIDKNSLCIIETDKKEDLDIPNDFELTDIRVYGIARFSFVQML